MKVPLIWLNDYIDLKNKSASDIANSFTALGLMLDKPIKNQVLDLEHRMDRSDWLSIIGCARDLAAYENLPLKLPKTSPFTLKPITPATKVDIRVETPAVHRFNTRVFKNITVQPSPQWLKDRLEAYGIPSINNIVDITNFVMVEYGQPMHAQDLAKFDKREIVIRQAKKGEIITTLLGETIKLIPEAFVLTQNQEPIVIGGIVGGQKTAVTSQTTEIILDAGNYDQKIVRRASRQLKIQNETVSRYDKFLHPKLTEIALDRATDLILKLAGGEAYSNIDWYPNPVKPRTETLRYQRLKTISGLDLPPQHIKTILGNLGYRIINQNQKGLELEIPYFRTDIQVEDDLIADILRIHGYVNIPTTFIANTPPPEITSDIYKFEENLKKIMVNMGFHEHITDPLVPINHHNQQQVVLANSLTSEKSALRTSLYQTLQTVLTTYKKHQVSNIKLFEIGLTYHQLKDQPQTIQDFAERRTLCLISHQPHLDLHENSQHLRAYLARLFQQLNITTYFKRHQNRHQIIVGQDVIGHFNHEYAEILTEKLLQYSQKSHHVASNIPNYPKEDLSLIIPLNLELGPILYQLKQAITDLVETVVLEEYQDETLKDNHQKSVLVRAIYKPNANIKEVRQKVIQFFKKNDVMLKC